MRRISCAVVMDTGRRKGLFHAVDKLTVKLQFGRYHFLVEADIQGFFDNLNNDDLMEMLSRRIGDRELSELLLASSIVSTVARTFMPCTPNSKLSSTLRREK